METDFSKTRWLKDVDKAFLNKVKTIYYFGKLAFMIAEDDDYFSIGKNCGGMLGIGSDKPEQVFTPQKVKNLSQKRVTNFSCGGYHVVALTEDLKLYTWGRNDKGQLGLGHKDDIYSPMMVQGYLSGKHIIQVACGYDYTFVLTSNGKVFAAGDNSYGQLGIRSTINQLAFVQIENGIENYKIIQISCGIYHSAAISSSGEIFLWESTCYGQTGAGNKNNPLTPCKLTWTNPIKKVAVGFWHTLALAKNGVLHAWGSDEKGQLGIKNNTESLTEPIRTCEELGVIIDIFAIGNFSCCKTDANKVYVWGKCNENNQISPRISQFTDLMQAALDAEVFDNYQPIIIALKRTLVDILDCSTVDEDSINSGQTTAWKSHLKLLPIRLLGKGSFGNVWKAQHIKTKQVYAIKRISFNQTYRKTGRDLNKILREVEVQEKMKHECVVKLQDFWFENLIKEIQRQEVILEETGTSNLDNYYFLFIQMELCHGDLTHLLNSKQFPSVTIIEISKLFKQLITGLEIIHKMDIIHRDLKPENIFFKKMANGLIWKIGDFGLAFEPTGRPSEHQSVAGTYLYQSPEMQKGFKYTNKTDVFSLGVVFFETLLRIQSVENTRPILFDIQKEDQNRRIINQYLSRMSFHDKFEDLLVQMLNPDPDDRPSTIEISSYIPIDFRKLEADAADVADTADVADAAETWKCNVS